MVSACLLGVGSGWCDFGGGCDGMPYGGCALGHGDIDTEGG